MEKRKIVTNAGANMMLVFTEPEAQDYWLRPGETLEIRVDVASVADDFELAANDDGITVWPSSGMGYISVWSGNRLLQCGHQRPTT